jgi:hypothetical protein
MYPRNAASPPRIAIGAVVQISDGAVQTSGITITVCPEGGAEAAGTGTTSVGANGTVYYTPVQSETNYTAFVVEASKTGCIPVAVTIVTTASATSGETVVTGHTPQTGDSFAYLGTNMGANGINLTDAAGGEIAVLDGKLDDIWGVVNSGVHGNAALKTLIDDVPTNTELAAAFTEIKGAGWASFTDTLEAMATNIALGNGYALNAQNSSAAVQSLANGASGFVAIDSAVDAIQSDVTSILANTGTDIPATLATLATAGAMDTLIAQVDIIQEDTTTDIPAVLASMAGATFDTTTDSLEAIRLRGDAAWTTGAGGSAPTVEDIRTEIDTNSTQLAAIKAKTDNLPSDPADASDIVASFASVISAIGSLNDISVNDILTTALADAYAAHGNAPTLQQAIMWIHQHLDDSAIVGTLKTVKKIDGTTAGTLRLDDATTPTSITRES